MQVERILAAKSCCELCKSANVILKKGEEFLKGVICDCVDTISKPPLSKELSVYMIGKQRAVRMKKFFAIDPALEEQEAFYKKALKDHEEQRKYIEELAKKVSYINHARLPLKYENADLEKLQEESLSLWCESISAPDFMDNTLLLCGGVGTGKTFASIAIAKNILLNTNKSLLYISSSELFSLIDKRNKADFNSYDRKICENELDHLESTIKSVDVLILDEIGIQSISTESKKERVFNKYLEIIDHRYHSNKISIYISNHSFDEGTSIEGKTLDKKIGERAASRLQEAFVITLQKKDKRKALGKTLVFNDQQDNNSWTLPSVGADRTSLLHWLWRTPVFEIISKGERATLTEKINGEIEDLDRRRPSKYSSIWQKNDVLTVSGCRCDINDGIVFLALIQLLHTSHYQGEPGITLQSTFPKILKTMAKNTRSTSAATSLKRSLSRLTRVRIKYQSSTGDTWIGGLLESVAYEGERKSARVIIGFNRDIIKFYKKGWFSSFNINVLSGLDSYSKKIQTFLATQKETEKIISIKKWKQILGQENIDDKSFRKTIKKSIMKQKSKKLLSEETTFINPHTLKTVYLLPTEYT